MHFNNARVTYLFQILPFTYPKNLSYAKRTFYDQINCITKEIFTTFLMPAKRLVCVIQTLKSLATLTSFSGVCYSAHLKSQV